MELSNASRRSKSAPRSRLAFGYSFYDLIFPVIVWMRCQVHPHISIFFVRRVISFEFNFYHWTFFYDRWEMSATCTRSNRVASTSAFRATTNPWRTFLIKNIHNYLFCANHFSRWKYFYVFLSLAFHVRFCCCLIGVFDQTGISIAKWRSWITSPRWTAFSAWTTNRTSSATHSIRTQPYHVIISVQTFLIFILKLHCVVNILRRIFIS